MRSPWGWADWPPMRPGAFERRSRGTAQEAFVRLQHVVVHDREQAPEAERDGVLRALNRAGWVSAGPEAGRFSPCGNPKLRFRQLRERRR